MGPKKLDAKRRAELIRRLAVELPKARRGSRLLLYRHLARQFGVSVDTIRYYAGRGAGLPPVQPGNPDLVDTVPIRRPMDEAERKMIDTWQIPKQGGEGLAQES